MTNETLDRLTAAVYGALRPPAKRPLSEWVEENVRLPSSIAAQPGPLQLWPHQRAIADSIGDPDVERVSVLKSARIGYTQLLVAALGHYAVNDPGPVLAVLPAEQDCRHLMTASIEPTFAESPSLRQALMTDVSGRDTMLNRFFAGGSLAIVSANAPRNLRARTARILFLDEVDGFEVDARGEGDPVALAEKRTLSYSNRKIVLGSTPVDEETSRVLAAYGKSDKRVFECPCPHCGDFHEIAWKDIHWEKDRPETAHWACPSCGAVTEHEGKSEMVQAGRWRATQPEVEGHHGYKINALVSLLPNASWARLAAEFLEAKKSPTTLKAFTTTLLAEPWRPSGDDLDPATFRRLQISMGPDDLPDDVLFLTAGVDCQGDRLESTLVGWTEAGDLRVLEHSIVWGSPLENATWTELDAWLLRQFHHPRGGLLLGVDAAIVDSGNWADSVYDFTRPRTGRRVVAGKGVSGFHRPMVGWGKSRRTRLAQVGVDGIKMQLFERITDGRTVRFADHLGPDYFDQINSERLVTKYSRGRPIKQWETISGRRNEGLDCLVYATAARQVLNLDAGRRAEQIESRAVAGPQRPPVAIRSHFLGG